MKLMKERITERKEIYKVFGDLFDNLMSLAEQGYTKEELKQLTKDLGCCKWIGSYVYHLNNFANKFISFLDRIGV